MVETAEKALANADVGQNGRDVPDTVCEEVEVLVRCALREAKG